LEGERKKGGGLIMRNDKILKVGEVIETNTTGFIAQCYQLYQLPPLGSLVRTKSGEFDLYAMVYNATTTSFEPGRKPIARGSEESSEEAIHKTNPQLEKLLKSEFSVLVVGHRMGNEIKQYLPPVPARIHSFVYLCSDDEVKKFSQSLNFLNILLNTNSSLRQDELVAACLRYVSNVQDDSHSFLIAAGKYLATLLDGDYNQLKSILERIRP
jgi:hypothetical protein